MPGEVPTFFRLFAAIPVPEAVREQLVKVQAALRREIPATSIRWTSPEQMHLTLRFYGDVPTSQLPQLMQALRTAAASHHPITLRAMGLGAFPTPSRPRVLWAGVQGEPANALIQLWQSLNRETANFGSPPDHEEFTGHLTLGRIKLLSSRNVASLAARIAAHEATPFGTWQADCFDLMRSELTPAGARHALVERFACIA
ncbi:MAG: RNA 2',3'-cyclic phosphodiesterase [Verrucomicrobiota bacterium]